MTDETCTITSKQESLLGWLRERARFDSSGIYTAAADEIERLTIGLRRAFKAMESVTVFVTSRERIKRPEGEQWWHEEKVAAFHALQPPAAPESRDG